MTREAFITKWLGNEAAKYTEEFRDLMWDDLDKVIDFHIVAKDIPDSSTKTELEIMNEVFGRDIYATIDDQVIVTGRTIVECMKRYADQL